MHLNPEGLDRLLLEHRAAIERIVAPQLLDAVLPEIRAEFVDVVNGLAEEAECGSSLLKAADAVSFRYRIRDEIARLQQEIRSILAFRPVDRLPPLTLEEARQEIQSGAERRRSQVETDSQVAKLVLKIAEDVRIHQYVRRAKTGGQKEFLDLWWQVREDVVRVIRRAAWRKGDSAMERAEDQTMNTIQRRLPDYASESGFFLSWARGIALRTAIAIPFFPEMPEAENPGEAPPPDPPDEPRDNLLCMVRELVSEYQPHHPIAFLLVHYLEWKPTEVVSELADKPLGELVAELAEELTRAAPGLSGLILIANDLKERVKNCSDRQLWDYVPSQFADPINRLKNPTAAEIQELTKTFARFLPEDRDSNPSIDDLRAHVLAASISRWAGGFKLAIWNNLLVESKRFLRLIAGTEAPPLQRIAFLYCRVLGEKPEYLAARRQSNLADLLEQFCHAFAVIRDLRRDQIDSAVAPLKRRIMEDRNPTLSQCCSGDLVPELARGASRVTDMVLKTAKREQLAAYAYLLGCFPVRERSPAPKKQVGGKP